MYIPVFRTKIGNSSTQNIVSINFLSDLYSSNNSAKLSVNLSSSSSNTDIFWHMEASDFKRQVYVSKEDMEEILSGYSFDTVFFDYYMMLDDAAILQSRYPRGSPMTTPIPARIPDWHKYMNTICFLWDVMTGEKLDPMVFLNVSFFLLACGLV